MENPMRKQLLITLSVLVSVTGLLACSHKPEAPAKPMDPKDTVFGDDIRAIEKAKSVQETLNKDKANTDKAIEASSDAKLPLSTD